jgi:hypothetical protein
MPELTDLTGSWVIEKGYSILPVVILLAHELQEVLRRPPQRLPLRPQRLEVPRQVQPGNGHYFQQASGQLAV